MRKRSKISGMRSAIFGNEQFDAHPHPLVGFWQNIILQAVYDATRLNDNNVTKRNYAKQAIVWLWFKSEDHDAVCNYANFNSSQIRKSSQKWLSRTYEKEELDKVLDPYLFKNVVAKHRKGK